ncbi:MAG TPA: hypothetical protein VG944_10245 [Fimbriimonas sp.]|nr:hypothetical protein [Fimbriimonas sp.]
MRARVRRGLAIVLGLIVGFYCCALGYPLTPEGVQCPTAPIQWVAVVGHTRCGCPTVSVRKTQKGDAGFVQCTCAEKKKAKTGATLSGKVVFALERTIEVRPASPRRGADLYTLLVAFHSRIPVPATLPPLA